MPGPPWSDDPDTPELSANLAALYPDVIAHALSGVAPDLELPKVWHERMHAGISAPSGAYIGRYRGDTHSDLLDYENNVSGIPGARSYLVWGEVDRIIRHLVAEVTRIEKAEMADLDRDMAVLELAATTHGEWVRVHPFVNGNGRTARLWVLWICARFSIPPLVRVRPRPAKPYGPASFASMTTDHSLMLAFLKQQYNALP